MRTLILAAALVIGGAAVAQTYGTTQPDPSATHEQHDTAMPDTTATTTAMAPASSAVVQPSNANPELDARGIPVISDVAYVPPGFNGLPATAVGGPVEGDDESYPPCTRERTDNCTQTYERGVD